MDSIREKVGLIYVLAVLFAQCAYRNVWRPAVLAVLLAQCAYRNVWSGEPSEMTWTSKLLYRTK